MRAMAQAEVAAAGTVQAAVILLDMVQAAATTAVLPEAALREAALRAVTLDHCVDFTLKSMTMFMRKWLRAQLIMAHLADLRVADRLADTLQCVIPQATAVRVADPMVAHRAGAPTAGAHRAGARREGVPITAVAIPPVVRSVILTAAAVPVHR